jgi:uncharacterized membrane protein YphA (DoxX/SURF4 family)
VIAIGNSNPARCYTPRVSDAHVLNDRAIAFLRIAVGLFFLIFGEYKVFGSQFAFGGGFQFWIHKFLEGGAYPFMVPVLRGFVLPHATAIALLAGYGEFAIGLALCLGILVRPASVAGVVYMLTLLFTRQLRRLRPVPTGNALQTHSACFFTLAVCSTILLRHDAIRLWDMFHLGTDLFPRLAQWN